jgi:hypothetical protein
MSIGSVSPKPASYTRSRQVVEVASALRAQRIHPRGPFKTTRRTPTGREIPAKEVIPGQRISQRLSEIDYSQDDSRLFHIIWAVDKVASRPG